MTGKCDRGKCRHETNDFINISSKYLTHGSFSPFLYIPRLFSLQSVICL